jgi:hypothetical protein
MGKLTEAEIRAAQKLAAVLKKYGLEEATLAPRAAKLLKDYRAMAAKEPN